MSCQICSNQVGNTLHQAREMFLGLRDRFEYVECSACGTLQIQSVPDLRRYYPPNYYSFQPADSDKLEVHGSKRLARYAGHFVRQRAADYYSHGGDKSNRFSDRLIRVLLKPLGHVVVGYPEYLLQTQIDLGINRESHILDVGAGAGLTLEILRHFGFKHLLGVDPFLENDVVREDGILLLKATVNDLNQQFDLVLANHSLEHASDPVATLREIHRLLKPGRYAIIRMPVVSYAWRKYGTNWAQLDAPRHLFLFTADTFSNLAARVGFEVKEIRYDSTSFQFWGSEQYVRNVPLLDESSYFVNPEKSSFTATQIASYSAEAAVLNARGEGDQAVFYLRKELATGD